MIKKDLVRKNFSKSSHNYDNYAIVQKHMANELMENFAENFSELKILEIGSGTGILTEKLIKKFPNSKITLLDISSSMIEICKGKFGDRLIYLVEDAEKFEFKEKFDLIISNATFQWFNNLEETIINYKKKLNSGGKIFFSTFAQGTYKELNESFISVSKEYKYSQNFKSEEQLKKLGKIIKSECYYEEFPSLLDFLKSIKGIGAQSSLENKKNISYGIIKKVEKEYLKNYGKIKVSNVLSYVEVSEN